MEIAMVGLGRMGGNMARRLLRGGHQILVFDRDPGAGAPLRGEGARVLESLAAVAGSLASPRHVWLMVPSGPPVDGAIDELLPLLAAGDVLVDGGNSRYLDSVRRADACRARRVHFVDAGTSGGIWGLEEGYSLMVGGPAEAVASLRPALETLAPAPDRGWGHVGPSGAGHFVKMVHNGIEYGMMQALAEGFALMEAKGEFRLDLHQIAEIWRYGSVVRSWLLDLTSRALEPDAGLEKIAPYVADSGEGRWTVAEAIELGVPAPVITQSLIQRLQSRDHDGLAFRLLAAMRQQFGGHPVKRAP